MKEILFCMFIDPYFFVLALLQMTSWVLFFFIAIRCIRSIIFDENDEECYE